MATARRQHLPKPTRKQLNAQWRRDGLDVDQRAHRFRQPPTTGGIGAGGLESYRLANDLSQVDVAAEYTARHGGGITGQIVSRWEHWPHGKDSIQPRLVVLERLADIYHTTVVNLVATIKGDEMPVQVGISVTRLTGDELTPSTRAGPGTGDAVLRNFEATTNDELRRILGLPNVSAAQVERLEHAAAHYLHVYPARTPTIISDEVADHYRAVDRLLNTSPRYERRLLSVAGELAGVMSWLSFDTHRPALAHDYLDVGIAAAERATDQRLATYLAAARNRIATLTDDDAAILEAAEDATVRAKSRPGGRLGAWICGIEARGHAGLGHLREAEAALAASETALETADGDEPELAFFGPARLRALAGECYVLLDRPPDAVRHLEEALRLLRPGQAKLHVMILLDTAMAQVKRGEYDAAQALLERAGQVDPSALVATHTQRVGKIQHALAAARN